MCKIMNISDSDRCHHSWYVTYTCILYFNTQDLYIDGLVQERRKSIALAMEYVSLALTQQYVNDMCFFLFYLHSLIK